MQSVEAQSEGRLPLVGVVVAKIINELDEREDRVDNCCQTGDAGHGVDTRERDEGGADHLVPQSGQRLGGVHLRDGPRVGRSTSDLRVEVGEGDDVPELQVLSEVRKEKARVHGGDEGRGSSEGGRLTDLVVAQKLQKLAGPKRTLRRKRIGRRIRCEIFEKVRNLRN